MQTECKKSREVVNKRFYAVLQKKTPDNAWKQPDYDKQLTWDDSDEVSRHEISYETLVT